MIRSWCNTALRNNFPGFACWGDLILSEFQNQSCACSAQSGQKCESGSLFNTKIPVALRMLYYIIMRGTYNIFWYMKEEGNITWTLMVSYSIQNYTDNKGIKSNNMNRIGNARDLSQLALLLDI